MLFYVGIHMPSRASEFERCMVSVNRLRDRRSDFRVNEWMLDSGAFTEISTHGGYRSDPAEYAEQVVRWSRVGKMVAAVSQDFMCEPFIIERTGLTLREHQLLTVDRYDAIKQRVGDAPLLPVLQGFAPSDYVQNVRDYGKRLAHGAWVGVGSVCKRNATPDAIEAVLTAIYRERSDLRLHGFGIKLTALSSGVVRSLLYSADSMAWSFHARRNGRSANCMNEAAAYVRRVHSQEWQRELFFPTDINEPI